MLLLIMGPMRTGKTETLKRFAKLWSPNVAIYDSPNNTRKSKRDLKGAIIVPKDSDYAIIDEVHMSDPEWVMEIIARTTESVAIAGLQYDYYSKMDEFPIWSKLRAKDPSHVRFIMQDTNPCSICGRFANTLYSVSTDPKKGRVGDHYHNVCFECIP